MDRQLQQFAALLGAFVWESDAQRRFVVFAGPLPACLAQCAAPAAGIDVAAFLQSAVALARALAQAQVPATCWASCSGRWRCRDFASEIRGIEDVESDPTRKDPSGGRAVG